MYAIRCHRIAAGADVDGQHFAHEAWTLTEEPTETQLAESAPTPGFEKPLLTILEVEDENDPALKPFPVAKETTEDKDAKAKEENKGDAPVAVPVAKMNKTQLLAHAEANGIEVPTDGTNAQIVQAITQATESKNAPGA